MLAHDTRASARELVAAAAAGVAALGGVAVHCGLLTTPQLHWMVRQANAAAKHDEAAYFGALAAGFASLVAHAAAPAQVSRRRLSKPFMRQPAIGVPFMGLELCLHAGLLA